MTIATLAALLLAAAAPSAADRVALDAEVTRIYRGYSNAGDHFAAWERARFSAATAALVARWRRVAPNDEVDELSDGDWFCLCQDPEGMRWSIIARRFDSASRASATVRLDFGGTRRDARLIFVRERGRWKLDDLFATHDFPRGLKQVLRETIAQDSKR